MCEQSLFIWEEPNFIKLDRIKENISSILDKELINIHKNSDKSKKFYEEVSPIIYLAEKLGAIEIRYTNDVTEQLSYDAVIRYADSSEDKIEATFATNGYEDAIIDEMLDKFGHVSLSQPIEFTGTKNKRSLKEQKFMEFSHKIDRIGLLLSYIQVAIEKKTKEKYQDMILCVVVNTAGVNLKILEEEINVIDIPGNIPFKKIFLVSNNPGDYGNFFIQIY